ncbi:MAG: DUF87 domain-containing protein, partial [Asgard group archaeon]|nr:DUF87 domain-containing protein [Asgard group archaeon]
MNIRWRLSILFVQIVLLGCGTWLATSELYSSSLWFMTGLLAIAIYPQLLEPFFPRAVDVMSNSIIGLFLFFIANKSYVLLGWNIFALGLVVSLIMSLIALILGTRRQEGILTHLGRFARIITKKISARIIYSIVFWLALLEFFSGIVDEVWILGSTWALILIVSGVDWQNAWSTLKGAPTTAEVEGMIGPSRLIIRSISLPTLGTHLSISCGNKNYQGVLVGRIRREKDFWGLLLISSLENCEEIRSKKNLELSIIKESTQTPSVLGTVDIGSTEKILQFAPIRNLEIGEVVAVSMTSGEKVHYQIASAEVSKISSKNDSHLIIKCIATQIGRFNQIAKRLEQHRWVPEPGVAVEEPSIVQDYENDIPENKYRLGRVASTDIPVYMDLEEACGGHIAILGMTKMGKTSLAIKIAQKLSNDRSVTVLDQTGEYKNKMDLPCYQNGQNLDVASLSVYEPPSEDIVAADFAYNFLKNTVVHKAKQ